MTSSGRLTEGQMGVHLAEFRTGVFPQTFPLAAKINSDPIAVKLYLNMCVTVR